MPLKSRTRDARILIVDDEAANISLLDKIVRRAGYTNVRSTARPREVVALCTEEVPDIVLLDLHMPDMDGIAVMDVIRSLPQELEPLVLILTGDPSREARTRALSKGAKDFISKPFDVDEVLLRIRNLLDLRMLHLQLREHSLHLEEMVRERTSDLEEARLEVIDRLAMAAEFRDDATGQHTRRVGSMAARIARQLGWDADNVELIRRAAPLHDVGKIAIPDSILLKNGPLTVAERLVMQTHTTIGSRLLSKSRSPLLVMAQEIALCHHERWVGDGYPAGLAGAGIPLTARIVAVADFYDALTHDRPYRAQHAPEFVLPMIESERGRHFDPAVVDAFLAVHHASAA